MAPSREIEKLQRRWQENPLGLTFAPLAEAYRKEGMCADALELLEIGLAQHPSYVPAHIVRGRCFLDTKSESAAEQAFARVTELDPENVIALKGLADIAERAGRYTDAMGHLERLLAFDRANEEARFQLDRLRAHQHIPMTGGVDVVPENVPVIAPDQGPKEPLPPALAPQSTAASEGTWAQPAVPEPAMAPGPTPAAEPTPAVELPKAEIVDAERAALEIEVYHPVELTAGPTNEYQSASDADALEPAVAGGRSDFDHATAHWPESAEPAPAEDPAVQLSPLPGGGGAVDLAPPGVDAVDERAGDVVAGVPGEPEVDSPAPSAETPLPEAAPDGPADQPVLAEAASGPPAIEPRDWSEPEAVADVVAEVTVEAIERGPADESETMAEPEVEADPELVVTETMAEIFLRQGHRQLALAVYTQLLERDSTNDRIRAALEMLQEEFRPAVPSTLPAFAAVLTGGQSVRGYFEQLLSARRPGPAAPDASISLGEVFGDEQRPGGKSVGNQPDPSFDEFFGDGGNEPLPAAREPEPPLPADSASEDLEQFTDWLRGLRR